MEITINHNWANTGCVSADKCHYMFLIHNQDSDFKTFSMMVSASLTNPGDIYLSRKYANEIASGSYFYYEIS
jgi:hypothetical protein